MTWTWFRRTYLSIDPRTLGLVRIAIASLLLFDLAKRSCILSIFYTNKGLIPNHRMLWRPMRESTLSFLFALSAKHEVCIAFALIALVYLCLLIGYRTRLAQILSWICLVSLHVRVDLLANGADFVFGDLLLWTAFLPLGRRFSVDALLPSLRGSRADDIPTLQQRAHAPRDTQPFVSFAVLAALSQLCVIYTFNAIHKHGSTWRNGSAVYWLMHQERIVTPFGLWFREHAPWFMFQMMTYGTLVVEGALPLLILSPWGRPWTRRIAILLIFGLHGAIALVSNLGVFSPVMMVFSVLLVEAADWQALQARAQRSRRLQLFVDEACGLSWQLSRLWLWLDAYNVITLQPMAAGSEQRELAAHGGYAVADAEGRTVWVLEPALRKLLWALPGGWLWVACAQLLRPITTPLLRWAAHHRGELSNFFGLQPAGAAAAGCSEISPATPAPSPFRRRVRVTVCTLRELAVAAFVVLAITQVLEENQSIPVALKHWRPHSFDQAIEYFRLNQGWSMFAPNAPRHDMWIVVDAQTVDGRHVDPYNEVASRIADPTLRSIPPQLGQSAAFCDYTLNMPGEGVLHEPFRDWIMNYHRRTHQPNDRITRFRAYVIEHDPPRPDQTEPTNVQSHVFLSEN